MLLNLYIKIRVEQLTTYINMKKITQAKNSQIHFNYSQENELIDIYILARNEKSVITDEIEIKELKNKIVINIKK